MAIRSLIAQMYSQDLSEKVRSSKDAASRSGKIVTSQPTYGYDFDKNNRHKFVLNSEESTIVKKIYDLYEKGVKASEIAKVLNSENILSPLESKRAKGYKVNDKRIRLWGASAVRNILRNEKYIGKWIYGKSRVVQIGSKRAYPAPKSEWIVIDGAIPQIISKEQFDKVQKSLDKSAKAIHSQNKHAKRREITKDDEISEKADFSQIKVLEISIKKATVKKMSLWEDFINGLIPHKSFTNKNNRLSEQIKAYESSIASLKIKCKEQNNL